MYDFFCEKNNAVYVEVIDISEIFAIFIDGIL